MIVNDNPGEECRIAILKDGHLEELFSERTNSATNVGNIYKGRVAKVEPAIQAAFVDYGEGQSGFLHITDLHPRYFPGEEKTERVGKRISRRERPLIQHALKSGHEVLVQVMKQGIGTKGPTLTSYLSIPGRLMVMMPDMDRVGVSRKVEDEEQRREMRDILNGLDLPPGFGFILRTAGFGKNKLDLKRDVAYLQRLWKIMERRKHSTKGPVELYTESDLLIRTIRDVLRPSIQAIVVDSPSAYERAAGFLRVVAPRSAPKVTRYRSQVPIFHAFDIERQVELIHSREVPLASGGAIVIDQTEALVAIDVNSGRSRSARDSETNAYETNIEAVDEISRQLRLRDLGGLIVNDLIDMRSMKHRRDIEERFRENLKRDRARTMITRISEFGILEMTRQRMRPSMRKLHYMPCPHCAGHGEVKMPESIGADAARQIGYLLQFDRVQRVELVCSPRVASVLLSGKRRELVAMEDATGKTVDVRVSDAIAIDRVDYYAYDERGADIDIEKLPRPKMPTIAEIERQNAAAERDESRQAPRERRTRDTDQHGPADAARIVLSGAFDDLLLDDVEDDDAQGTAAGAAAAADSGGNGAMDAAGVGGEESGGRRRRRRRRRRGGRGRDAFPVTGAGPADDSLPPVDGGEPVERETLDAAITHETRSDVPAPTLQESFDDATQELEEPVSASSLAMRVHQLARQLGVKSKEIIDRCAALAGFSAKNHMSSVPGEVVEQIVTSYQPEQPADAAAAERDDDRDDRSTRYDADETPTSLTDDDEESDDRSAASSTQEWPGSHAQTSGADRGSDGEGGGGRRRRRRRRGRRGRGGSGAESGAQTSPQSGRPILDNVSVEPGERTTPDGRDGQDGQEQGGGGRRKRRRRRRGRGGGGNGAAGGDDRSSQPQGGEPLHPTIEVRRQAGPGSSTSGAASGDSPKAARPRRALYRSRTKIQRGSRGDAGPDGDE